MTGTRSDAHAETEQTKPAPSPESLIERLKTLLDVEELDRDLYRGTRQPGGQGRVFGGQVIAQALMAATRSTEAHQVAHSLHAYFMRPGDEALPIVYRVVRDHDGRSFSTRRVIAMQRGVPILNLAASFQALEPGLAHQAAMPDVPLPESLIDEAELMARYRDQIPQRIAASVLRPRPIQIRRVESGSPLQTVKGPPLAHVWFRAAAPVGDDRAMHRAILAYASDMALLGTCMRPHGISWITHDVLTASLDHALWLHEDVAVDDWLLYVTDSPWSGHARGFTRGQIFSRDGRLVASTAQEGLVRLRD